MKKFLLMLVLSFSMATITHAQDSTKSKIKETSTVPQKMHNAVSKHKKHSGVKTKHKHNDVTYKGKYNTNKGEVKKKTDK